MLNMSLTGKVAIITGACSGIGAATAALFASEGCILSIAGQNNNDLNMTKSECMKNGLAESQLLLFIGDVRDHHFLEQLVKLTIDKFDKLNILINNAGVAEFQPILETSAEKINDVFSVNLMAPISLIKLCAPHLKQTNGNIVNTSSIAALKPLPVAPIYGASKAALNYVTECLALELAPEVRINCVNPGYTKTQIFGRDQPDQASADLKLELTAPLGRMAEAKEIAVVILFLAGDDAKYMTGEKLVIDGGILCGKKLTI